MFGWVMVFKCQVKFVVLKDFEVPAPRLTMLLHNVKTHGEERDKSKV